MGKSGLHFLSVAPIGFLAGPPVCDRPRYHPKFQHRFRICQFNLSTRWHASHYAAHRTRLRTEFAMIETGRSLQAARDSFQGRIDQDRSIRTTPTRINDPSAAPMPAATTRACRSISSASMPTTRCGTTCATSMPPSALCSRSWSRSPRPMRRRHIMPAAIDERFFLRNQLRGRVTPQRAAQERAVGHGELLRPRRRAGQKPVREIADEMQRAGTLGYQRRKHAIRGRVQPRGHDRFDFGPLPRLHRLPARFPTRDRRLSDTEQLGGMRLLHAMKQAPAPQRRAEGKRRNRARTHCCNSVEGSETTTLMRERHGFQHEQPTRIDQECQNLRWPELL
jgi:hypothetical protein